MSRRTPSLVGAAAAILLAATFGPSRPALADRMLVDLQLVLAVDVSRSMDFDEQELQRLGYMQALTSPEVLQAIGSGAYGRIAVTYLEWAGATYQDVIVPWRLIHDSASAAAFAAELGQSGPGRERWTSISGGLGIAGRLLEDSAYEGLRQVIDVSGDGPNNQGPPVELARDQLIQRGVVINGLPITLKRGERSNFGSIANLDAYYRDCVIGGPGAFMIAIDSMDQFVPATRQKLIMEIAGLAPLRTDPVRPVAGSDCLIGEKMWRQWMDP